MIGCVTSYLIPVTIIIHYEQNINTAVRVSRFMIGCMTSYLIPVTIIIHYEQNVNAAVRVF